MASTWSIPSRISEHSTDVEGQTSHTPSRFEDVVPKPRKLTTHFTPEESLVSLNIQTYNKREKPGQRMEVLYFGIRIASRRVSVRTSA